MTDPFSKDDLESMRHIINNRPEINFGDLSPNEMHDLLYHTFDSDSPLKINSHIPDLVIDQIPFFRLTEEFLKIIQRENHIKLTPLGALPKKVLVELYDHRFILEDGVETGIHKLTREIDSLALTILHYNTVLAGLIRKVNGKLHLTKQGEKLMVSDKRSQLFLNTFKAYTEKLNWSSFDGYPAVPIGNLGWGFTIILLLQFGNEPREQKFYAEKYIKAFPDFLQNFPQRQFSTPNTDLIKCFCLRSFERFLEWWGLVKVEKEKPFRVDELSKVIKTPALENIFSFVP